jgi:lipopolysaccharide export system permease protein
VRLLDRYLLRELLVPLGYCLSGFLLFWIVSDLFSDLSRMQELRLRAGDVAIYYFFRIPEFLPVAMPVALLLALLYALTNHARYNELTAIRAAGVGLWRLCLPYLAVGLAATGLLFALNEWCAPRSSELAEQIRTRRVQPQLSARDRQVTRKIDFRNSREDRYWHLGAYNPQTGEALPPIVVEWHSRDGSWRSIIADRAVRTNGIWTFYHAHEIQKRAATNSLPVSLPTVAVLPVPEFSETPEEIRSQISISERFAHQSRTHRADLPIADIVNYLRLNPHPPGDMRPWLYTKLHGRFAGPCTCLVVVLIAVPFAAASGRRNVFVGVAASITIFFVYFLLQQIGFAAGEAGGVAPWLAAWLPNLVFGTAGLWLMNTVR